MVSTKLKLSQKWQRPTVLVLPHNLLGPVSLATCIQLDDSIPNLMAQEHNTHRCRLSQKTFVFKGGFVEFPTEPGWGIELDEEAVADKLDHDWANLQSYDLDDNSM